MEIPNLVTDTIANEVTIDPSNGTALPLHCALMRNLGVTLTEICDLEKLAADCAEDGQYTFLYVAAPLKVQPGQRLAGQPARDQVTACARDDLHRAALAGALPRRARRADITPEFDTMLDLFRATVSRAPDAVAIRYFDGSLTFADLDARVATRWRSRSPSTASRPATGSRSTRRTTRRSWSGCSAAWKAGGSAVAINPMNKARELTYLLADSGATALLCLEELYTSVARDVIAGGEVRVQTVFTCSPLDEQSRNDERLFAGATRGGVEGTIDLEQVFAEYAGRSPEPVSPRGEDVAVLTYTSGHHRRAQGCDEHPRQHGVQLPDLPGLDGPRARRRRARRRAAVPHHRPGRPRRRSRCSPAARWCWRTGSSRTW